MCGIIGCNGVSSAVPVIIEGLKRLEYRGYDSAGIALCVNRKTVTIKKKGRVDTLINELKKLPEQKSDTGIGHTRWATHGEPSDSNAHPHSCGKFTLVHNGIIENHDELKEQYLKLSEPVSDTDTEIIVRLLDRMYGEKCIEAIAQTVRLLKGSFALAILCEDEPDKIFCVRHQSPLVIGIGNGVYAASDSAAIADKIHTLYRMDDCEIAIMNKSSAEFFDFELNPKAKKPEEFDHDEISTDHNGYEHFMLKEIREQPMAIKKTVESLFNGKCINLNIDIPLPEQIYVVACGSAYHAGLVGKHVFNKMLNIPVSVEIASEFRYCTPPLNKNTPVIIISQSGETADSLAALRRAKESGCTTISIVNVKHSAIALESDYVLFTRAGPEIAVATTKAYSSQLAALYALAIYFAEKFGTQSKEELDKAVQELLKLPQKIELALNCENEIKQLAKRLSTINFAYFIGRGQGYCTAAEGALKLKEISYIHCEAYPAGELKHGTISLIEKGTTVIAADSQPELTAKLQSNIDEVRSRGAHVIAVTCSNCVRADETVRVPSTNELFQVSTQIVPLQLLSYYVAAERGCDIDKPRNLAKSVTVE